MGILQTARYDARLRGAEAYTGSGPSSGSKLEPEEFDKQFLAWLDKQVRPTVDGYGEWQKTMKTLAAGASQQSPDDVIREGRQAISLYPEFVEGKSAYEVVADAFLKKDDKVNARKQLEQYAGSVDAILRP